MRGFRLPITKWGALSRMMLSAAIAFMVAIQLVHTSGKPLDFWAFFGAILLTLKDVQSFMNQAWGQAFLTSPPAQSPSAPASSSGGSPQ